MDADSMLKEIEETATKRNLPIIGPTRGKILDAFVRKYAPKRVLEIGTLVGYSAIRIARLLPEGGMLICLEKDGDVAKEARKNIAAAGLDDRVEVRIGDAATLIPKLDGRFDLVFIDAAKEDYLSYLTLVEKHIGRGSVVIADNAKRFAAEMHDYLEYVRTSGRYGSSYHEDPDGSDAIEVSVKR